MPMNALAEIELQLLETEIEMMISIKNLGEVQKFYLRGL